MPLRRNFINYFVSLVTYLQLSGGKFSSFAMGTYHSIVTFRCDDNQCEN